MDTFRQTQEIWAFHPTLSLDTDKPCKADPLSTPESIYHMSPCSTPSSPFTDSSPSSSDTEESIDSKDTNDSEISSSMKQAAIQQANLWCTALKEKKVAMEHLLQAQESLEMIQDLLAQHISVETIEGAHNRLLSGITPTTTPQARYLLKIGHLSVGEGPGTRNSTSFPGHVRPSHARAAG